MAAPRGPEASPVSRGGRQTGRPSRPHRPAHSPSLRSRRRDVGGLGPRGQEGRGSQGECVLRRWVCTPVAPAVREGRSTPRIPAGKGQAPPPGPQRSAWDAPRPHICLLLLVPAAERGLAAALSGDTAGFQSTADPSPRARGQRQAWPAGVVHSSLRGAGRPTGPPAALAGPAPPP